ncbi:DMT family transporter [Nocardioides campestrisoli]|uniref:DMT family transporter n=1 Tax=Nocardioides campestrisoli TaxID=2736757 RepID=UPI00163DD77B|nr:DMT family transporter [Nocardioides campestrisoli]
MTTTRSGAPAATAGHSPAPWLPLLAVGFTLVTWASAFVAIRHLGETVPPGSLSLGRLAVAVLALGVMVRLQAGREVRLGRADRIRWRMPRRADWPLVVLGGLSWIAVYNVALNEAERRIDAGTAALLVQLGPILVALLATVFLGDRLTVWLVAGLAIGFGGVVLIARASSQESGSDVLGVFLGVVAAVGFAIGVLTQKRLLGSGMTALDMTFWYYAVGLVGCLPWTVELVGVLGRASAADLWWIVYLGVFPSAIAFTTWAYALSHAEAGRFAMATFLVPFITALLAWLLLAEVPPALAFVGGALCLAGVLVSRVTRPVRPPASP